MSIQEATEAQTAGAAYIRQLLAPDPALMEISCEATRPWKGKIFDVETSCVLCPDGSHGYRELARHHGGAGVCAVRDGCICLVRQWRVSVGRMALEIPAGKIDGTEEPAVCASRELTEETGLVAGSLELLANSCGAIGFTDECTHIYYAHDLHRHEAHLDEGEFVDVIWVRLDDVLDAIRAGLICDSKTIVAVLMAREIARRDTVVQVADL